MTDAELITALGAAAQEYARRSAAGNGFAVGKEAICRSMIASFTRYGRWASLRQRNYAESLVRWTQPRPTTERAVQLRESLARFNELFNRARRNGMIRPKIRLQKGEWRIVVYPAPSTSRHSGGYYVKARRGAGRMEYCGVIAADGTFRPSAQCSLDVVAALEEFNASPAETAAAYGRLTGHCCFCGLGLSDSRSVAMGYGPVCADHYGLPWGDRRAPEVQLTEIGAALTDIERRVQADIGAALAADVDASVTRSSSSVTRRHPPTGIFGGAARREAPPLDVEDEDSHFM